MRIATASLLGLMAGGVWPRQAHAVPIPACTAADVSAADAGCPVGAGPCTITRDFDIANGCTLDFGARAVTLDNGVELIVGSGSVIIKAGSLVIKPGGFINGRGEDAAPDDRGGMIRIETTGNVTLEQASSDGRIDVSGTVGVGAIRIFAGGTVTVAGRLNADKLSPIAAGGVIFVDAGADLVTLPGSGITAVSAGSSAIDLRAVGNLTLGEEIDVSGDEGGQLSTQAGGQVTLRKVIANATGAAGSGGSVSALAGTQVLVLGDLLANGNGSTDGGGCGGDIDLASSFGDLTIATTVSAEGAISDGGGGFINLEAAGTLAVQSTAVVSAKANGGQGCGGEINAFARTITHAGLFDVSGGAGGGVFDLSADGAVTLSGTILSQSSTDVTDGGPIDLEAGASGAGTLLVTATGIVDASGGHCDTFGSCGAGGDMSLIGCDLTIAAGGQLVSRGGSGGSTTLSAREQLTIAGSVNTTQNEAASLPGGNAINHPSRLAPVIGVGSVQPAPVVFARATCTAFGFPVGCLVPCPVCGNGSVQYPETCDDGDAQGCDGCSAFCQVETCNDGQPCTADGCDPLLGCSHFRAPNGTPCPDGVACNGTETCQAGTCTPGTVPNCNDGTSCTVDSCAEPGGCQHLAVTIGTPCTDSDACTVGSTCTAGGICGTALVCDDTRECTTDTCSPATGCVFTNRTGACTDDGNQCTDDQCSAGNCTHPNRPNGTSCSDGFFCSVSDSCQAGACVSGGPRGCGDTNQCTADTCNEGTDACDHTPITPCCGNGVVEGAEQCDDGNTNNGDGCSNACTLLAGCGDGVPQAGEECDAGAANANTPDAACRPDCRLPRCGDAVTDPGRREQCDDANGTAGDGCSPRCYLEPPAGAGRIAGKGDATTDCVLEWAYENPLPDRTGQPGIKQTCQDGDPACDHGSTADECLFYIWVCANNVDPRFPACTPAAPTFGTVAFVDIRKPNEKDILRRPEDLQNRNLLLWATEAAASAPANDCGPRLAIRVPQKSATAKGTKALKLKGITTQLLIDSDSVKLLCTP